MNIYMKLFIPFLAGSSTLLGIIPTYFTLSKSDKIISYSLSFSAGIIVTLSVFSLIPESFNYLSNHISFFTITLFLLSFNIGIIINTLIDKTISVKNNDFLYKIGLSSLIVLIIHNIPEGIITFLTTSNNIKIGLSLSIAIALHNIPEGISIAIPIYYSTGNRKKAILLTAISGFSELFGAIISYLFIGNSINSFFMFFLLSLTSGIMIHLVITEIIPTIFKYNYTESFYFFIIGIIIMFLIILLM